jgi:hypothetical protein
MLRLLGIEVSEEAGLNHLQAKDEGEARIARSWLPSSSLLCITAAVHE